MTGWRASIEVVPEEEFGVIPIPDGGTIADIDWKWLGPGATFNFNGSNNWKYQNGIGNKKPELRLEGRFTSSWGGSVYLDYNNFYWLYMCFEGYSVEDGVHKFKFLNDTPTRSFSMRVVRLDRVVGGDNGDMITVLTGCRVNSFGWNYENNSGGLKADFSGNCVNWYPTSQDVNQLPRYVTDGDVDNIKKSHAVNWGCFMVKDTSDGQYIAIANNERASWKANRTINTVPNSCGRIDKASYESAIQPITLSSTVYSRDVDQWLSRFRNGGAQSEISATYSGLDNDTADGMLERGLTPMHEVLICSHDDSAENCSGSSPDNFLRVYFSEVGIDSWGNTYNTGSEITESPNMKAMDMVVCVKSKTLGSTPIADVVTGGGSGTQAQTNS